MAKQGDNSLVIQMPRQGIAQSPHVGYGDVRNLDLYTLPGVARLNKKQSASSLASGSFTAPNWIVRNPQNSSEFFALGSTGVVYTATDGSGANWNILPGNTKTTAHGNGLAIWKDYLFVARDTSLDTFGPLSGVACTVTAATPCVISSTGHGLVASTPIVFSGGTLPSGISANTVYYVSNINLLTDSFQIKDAIGGSQINTTTTGSGVKYRTWYAPNADGVSGFQTLTSDVLWHPMLVSKLDGKLYGGNAYQLFELTEVSTFNPISSGTYTWTGTALSGGGLPTDYRIKCIAEFGTNIYVGTWKGVNVNDFAVADIFPWDTSSSAFGNPIILNDFGVHALLTYGSSLIIWAGVNGSIYRSDGVNFSQVARLPMDTTSTEYVIWSPGAVAKYKERIFFGSGNVQSALPGQGIYSLQFTSKENILTLEHTVSAETDGTNEQTNIASILPISGQRLLAGYVSGANSGIDLTSSGNYAYTTPYTAYFDTPLYVVGKPDNKRVFTQVTALFAKKLATGEGIRISYRLNLTDSFTVLGTWTNDVAGTTTLGSVISLMDSANVAKAETIQFRIALALNTGTTTTPQLKQVVFE